MFRILLTVPVLFVFAAQMFSLTVYAPKAPPTIPLLKTAQILKNVKVVLYNDVQTEVLPKILKNDDGLYIIPSNIAAKLYNKGIPMRVLGVTTLGLLYVISDDPSVVEFKDLNGKKVSIGEPGSSPDVIARFLFARKNIQPEIVYGSTPSIVQYLIGGKIRTAVLPEPYASMALSKIPSARRIGDFRFLWESAVPGSAGIPQTVLAGKADSIEKHKNEIAALILQYEESVSWTHNVPKQSSRLGADRLKMNLSSETLEKSIFFMNLTFLSGKDAKKLLSEYFASLMQTDRQAVGEKLPDEAFYSE